MKLFWTILQMEGIKTRRSPLLWLAFGVPLALNLLMLCLFLVVPDLRSVAALPPGTPIASGQEWDARWGLLILGPIVFWSQLFLPVGIALIAAQTLGWEHNDNQFKHLLTLGPPRSLFYLAKLVLVILTVATSAVTSGVLSFGIGIAFLGGQGWPSVLLILLCLPLIVTGASLGSIGLHLNLATRFRNGNISIMVALTGMILGAVVLNYVPQAWPLFPWKYAELMFSSEPIVQQVVPLLSAGVALATTGIGLYNFQKADIH